MRHTILERFGTLGVLLCALALALTACDKEEEPTGLELEESEIERENGQIEEAEIEVEREELDEIDDPVGEELAGALDQEDQADDQDQMQDDLDQMQDEDEFAQRDPMQQDQMQQDPMQQDPMQQDPMQQDQMQQGKQEQDLTAVMLAPVDYIGMPVKGTATVEKVISDRGFWLVQGDKRIFAVVREDEPNREMIDINEGERLQLTGILMAPGDPSDITGKLEEETKKVAEQQGSMLVVSWRDIQKLDEKGSVGGGPDDEQEDPMEHNEMKQEEMKHNEMR